MMEYMLSPVLGAEEGDTSALCERLRNAAVTLTMAERQCAADLIEGKLRLPRHRPPSLKTHLRDVDIARRVEELTRKPGEREAAITTAMAEFRCSRSKVLAALRAHRGK